MPLTLTHTQTHSLAHSLAHTGLAGIEAIKLNPNRTLR